MKNLNFTANVIRSSVVILLAVSLGLLFLDTGASYISKWLKFDESLGHGLLIVAIIIYHIFADAKDYTNKQEKSRHWLLIVIIFGYIFQVISLFWGILIFQQFGLYLLWLLISIYVLGISFNKKIAFPLFFFLFAIPFWDFLNPLLLDLTSIVVTNFLKITSLVVFIEENRIETPYGVIEIASGCSGLKYFQIGLVIAIYAVYLENMTLKSKFTIIFAGALLGIITNWIRVTLLIFIGYESEMQSTLMQDHETFGFILFFIVISSILILINKYRIPNPNISIPSISEDNERLSISKITLKLALVFGCYLLILPLTNVISSNDTKVSSSQSSNEILNIAGIYSEKNTYIMIGDTQCKGIERRYLSNTLNKNVIPYKAIYNKKKYSIKGQSKTLLEVNGLSISVNTLSLIKQSSKEKYTLHYWYEYSDIRTTNHYIAKLLELSYIFKTESKLQLHAIICAQ
jgi:exosortase